MTDIRPVVAKNITELRKSRNWTQTELAQKLNYSDKAVSKWERAESVPDIAVLKEIVDLFGVSMDYLLEEEHDKGEAAHKISRQKKRNRLIVALLSASLVFLIATVAFVLLGIILPDGGLRLWMTYIYALPAAFIVLLVFNSLWGRRGLNFLIITLLVWSILLTLYLSFNIDNIWLIFIIGIPAQVIILLWARLKLKHK